MAQLTTTETAQDLLQNLQMSLYFLRELNEELNDRQFSRKTHGQFRKEMRKSQQIIAQLTELLQISSQVTLRETLSKDHVHLAMDATNGSDSSLLIDSDSSITQIEPSVFRALVHTFQQLCLAIEHEWKYGNKAIEKQQKNTSSPQSIGRYSNPNSPQLSSTPPRPRISPPAIPSRVDARDLPPNIKPLPPISVPKLQQKRLEMHRNRQMHNSPATTPTTPISPQQQQQSTLVPLQQSQILNQQILHINSQLESLMELSTHLQDLVSAQQESMGNIDDNVDDTAQNVAEGVSTIKSIQRSPWTYGIMGGMAAAAVGGPALAVGVGIKAALGGSMGLAVVGAWTGSAFANQCNESNTTVDSNEESAIVGESDGAVITAADDIDSDMSTLVSNENDESEEKIDDSIFGNELRYRKKS